MLLLSVQEFTFSLARSPVYSHLSTTLQGLPVIRAFKKQSLAMNLFHDFHNQHCQVIIDVGNKN